MSFNKMQKEARSSVDQKVKTLEAMLSEDYTKYAAVDETEEAALESRRVDGAKETLEVVLEDTRKNTKSSVTEGLLESGKQKVGVPRRNAEASQGNVPVLEKQRLSGEKNPVMEKEKYEKANDNTK